MSIRSVTLSWEDADRPGQVRPGTLTWYSASPLEMMLGFPGFDPWAVSRDLVHDGISGASPGTGDILVHVLANSGHPASGPALLLLTLRSPDGQIRFTTDLQKVASFLTETYTAVPRGREDLTGDVDGLLRALSLQP